MNMTKHYFAAFLACFLAGMGVIRFANGEPVVAALDLCAAALNIASAEIWRRLASSRGEK